MNMKQMTGFDLDDALELAGLRRKPTFFSTFFPAVLLVTAGVVVGASVGLAFAPSSGRRLRKEFGDRIDQLRERMKSESGAAAARNAANAISHQASS
jgi:hypothetical protein